MNRKRNKKKQITRQSTPERVSVEPLEATTREARESIAKDYKERFERERVEIVFEVQSGNSLSARFTKDGADSLSPEKFEDASLDAMHQLCAYMMKNHDYKSVCVLDAVRILNDLARSKGIELDKAKYFRLLISAWNSFCVDYAAELALTVAKYADRFFCLAAQVQQVDLQNPQDLPIDDEIIKHWLLDDAEPIDRWRNWAHISGNKQ